MSRPARLAALVFGLVLVLGFGGLLAYSGYARHRVLNPEKRHDGGQLYLPAHVSAAGEFFETFKFPLTVCVALGVGLILLAIFRKPPTEPTTRPPARPIDPLAD